jgi:hypothetical protein
MASTRRTAIGFTVGALVSLVFACVAFGLVALTGIGGWGYGVFIAAPCLALFNAAQCGLYAASWWRDYRNERADHERFFAALTDIAKRGWG